MTTPSTSPGTGDLRLDDARRLAASGDWRGLVERIGSLPDEELRAHPELGYLAADAHHRLGQMERALELATAVEAPARHLGDRRLALRIKNLIGVCLFTMGNLDPAEERFGELMEAALHWQDEEFAARASNNLGVIANVRGRRELALTNYQRALAAYQRLGYTRGLAQTHYNLGISYRDLGFDGEADAHYARAIEYAEASESEDVVALAEMERAVLRACSGDGLLAESMARRALARFERIDDPTGAAQAVRVMASAARVNGRDDQAAEYLERAYLATEAYPDPLLRAEVQRDRGLLFRDQGRAAAARDALADAEAHFRQIGAEAEAEAVVRALAEVPLSEPEPRTESS